MAQQQVALDIVEVTGQEEQSEKGNKNVLYS